ncbi:MAG: GNAT family N-acetyltransferase [Sphingomonadaceae bacterium]|nr:GNAT family N-acetyltransferase [Sphingomonadaceae bacterium]
MGDRAVMAPSAMAGAPPRADWLRPDACDGEVAAWDALCDASATPNVFARPHMVLSAARALGDGAGGGDGLHLLAVRADDTLIGILPITRMAHFGRLPIPIWTDWLHPNSFLSPIAIRAGAEIPFWQAVIAALSERGGGRFLHLQALPEQAAATQALVEAARIARLPHAIESRHQRAFCAEPGAAGAYWDAHVRPKKRKELRRQWNRLGEMGALETRILAEGQSADDWIAEFLNLEAAGWKGREGSALASAPGTRQFFTDAITASVARGTALLTALTIDGRAIAMLATLRDGNGAFSFKTAFDEGYARFSPGVLLQRESLNLFADVDGLGWVDSCAAEHHPMIDSLWAERRTICAIACALPGTINHLHWRGAHGAMRIWHAIKRGQPRPKDAI